MLLDSAPTIELQMLFHGGRSAVTPAPRVSVIIATYNRSGTVVEAIDSVRRQSFRDLEIIVVDDGSRDDTAKRIGAIEGPIRYLRMPHSGLPARTRNVGLRHAHGELVAFLDDDDSWEREKLARQVALLDAHPGLGLVYTGFSILGEDGSVHVPKLAPWQTAPGPLLGRLLRGCFIHPSTVLVRRQLLERVGGFDERRPVSEDYDLWLRLAMLSSGACIPEPFSRLRRGANLSTRDQRLVHDVSIAILEDLLATGALDLRQRLRCRAAISNLHVGAASLAREAGARDRGRHHGLAALRRNPVGRRAWAALGLGLLPAQRA
jgi:Glycosyl transferase family 2